MTVSISDITDALRWLWLVIGIVWIAYAWLHRVPYTRGLLGVIALIVLDWALHTFADFAEQPNSNIPSDFALYSVLMLVAALVGLGAASLYARWRGMSVLTILEAALLCVIVGGIGGRAYQVWANWNYYSENTDLISDLSYGGFGIRGALILGFLALLVFALVTHNSFWKLGDAAVIGLSIAQSIGWYGASLTHVNYGIALDAADPTGLFAPLAQIVRAFGYNAVQDLPDAYNLIAFRIPVQTIAALFFLGLFLFLLYTTRKRPLDSGWLFSLYVLIASFANFVFGFWRGDDTLMWNGLRVDQWFDVGLFLLGLALVGGQYVSRLQRRRVNFEQGRTLQHA